MQVTKSEMRENYRYFVRDKRHKDGLFVSCYIKQTQNEQIWESLVRCMKDILHQLTMISSSRDKLTCVLQLLCYNNLLLQSIWCQWQVQSRSQKHMSRSSSYVCYCTQGSHYILVVKFKHFSRTMKWHFQAPIIDGSLQHGQYYSNI